MKLTVFSHKPCWHSGASPTGYATDGGFPFQMQALSELFDETRLVLPFHEHTCNAGEVPLTGNSLTVLPLTARSGKGLGSKLSFLPWVLRNSIGLYREVRGADAIHCPIPGDVGTVGMLLAWVFRKPLFVRHCGNWLRPITQAEKFWRWFMERTAGGRNVMLATGGTDMAPSSRNRNVHWIFSSSLTRQELERYALPRSYPFKRTGEGKGIETNSPVRLIIVARQERAKGAGTIIESLPILGKRFPGITLEVVGEGSAIQSFKELSRDCGVTERVLFAGKLNHDQVMRKLETATLFVFPTTSSDGFPKAVLEGLASGLPVVATPVSVLPRLLGHGCGVLMEEATPAALIHSVEHALEHATRYEAMSVKAIETSLQYSLEAWRDKIGAYLTTAWGPLKRERSQDGERQQWVSSQ